MMDNEPKPATDAVSIQHDAATPDPEDEIQADRIFLEAIGTLKDLGWHSAEDCPGHMPISPTPTWRRSNRAEVVMWFAAGVMALAVAEVAVAFILLITKMAEVNL